MTNTYRRIAAVATGQLGLLSRRQANGVGVTNAQLRNRVSSGSLIQVGTDTFRLPGAPTDAIAELRALMVDVGGDVVASGRTAAALHGFDGYRLRHTSRSSMHRRRSSLNVSNSIEHRCCRSRRTRTLAQCERKRPASMLLLTQNSVPAASLRVSPGGGRRRGRRRRA
jgi:hypothetical protein